ncbi:sarcosine oxidase subunit delta [Mesorhizobium sp. DCY119]|uniref:sarcosine oxidase subunit delta n=1 Tax=Mesorhizobium sp. DCY119 TaxID=2108445 RepID=UPI000E7640FB|nr:sarcosine oxidase subunit delta [Mesorhizobium sp. DCY119]RJG40482.1 sarcosine oxidase subunit delta [Mesorhizobium sp. DCY119]
MRFNCPYCGFRGSGEFRFRSETRAIRPSPGASQEEWVEHIHGRSNLAGPHKELWQHVGGCRSWLVVERNTMTHEVTSVHNVSVPA